MSRERLGRAQRAMAEEGIDALLLSIGSDLRYLSGFEAAPSERLTMAVIPAEGDATVVVPRLEAPLVGERPGFRVCSWDETEDPLDVVAGLSAGAGRIAIGDQTWSAFLIGLQGRMPATSFRPATPLTRRLRARKDATEIEALRRAGAAADRVAARLGGERFSGRSERELAHAVEAMVVAEGHDEAWRPIVASGPNAASPHHQAGERTIAPGDTVVVDFGGRVDGYHSDTTRTFSVGAPQPDVAAAYAVLAAAQQEAVQAAVVGRPAQEVDRRAREIIASAGYGEYFIHRTGHGIGLDVHEHPYLVEGNDAALEAGNAFSVEPGIYMPGAWGMRIEDIVVATDAGPERLNESSRALVEVG